MLHLSFIGCFRRKGINNAQHSYNRAKMSHEMEWSPKRDINAIQYVPVVIERGGYCVDEHANTQKDETKRRMEEPEDIDG